MTEPSQCAVVTGANSGIGFETAKELALRGLRVILVCRNPERAEAAKAQITAAAGHEHVHWVLADLEQLSSIAKARHTIESLCGGIDVLINNAGAFFVGRQVSQHQFEKHFVVNHLAYMQVAYQLRPLMQRGGRVINVSSDAHRIGRIDFEGLRGQEGPGGMRAYAQSKLANILFTRHLAHAWKADGIAVNAVHPGIVATQFGANSAWWFGALMWLARPMLASPQTGAQTSIYLATHPDGIDCSGVYFSDRQPTTPSAAARNDDLAKKLVSVSEAMIEEALSMEK